MRNSTEALVKQVIETGKIDNLPEKHFIDGVFQNAQSGNRMETFDPGTAKAFTSFADGDKDDVDAAVLNAKAALNAEWRTTTPVERSRILRRASDLILENASRLAVAETLDCGKPLNESLADVKGASRAFEYYSGACDKLQGETFPLGKDYLGYSIQEPVGVTAQIIPWNFPFSTAARGIAPALAAGCTVVAKPAEQTPLTALMLADILHKSGLPKGVCNVVTGTGAKVGAPLVAHPDINHITFTGSVNTGISVMKSAADNVTRVLLELGGKSPVVVLKDCDMEAALSGVVGAIYENAGQICSAGSRLVIEEPIHEEFIERLIKHTKNLSIGHGIRDPQLGPVNSFEHLNKIEGFVSAARQRGCEIVTGGNIMSTPDAGSGWFFEPTIINNLETNDPLVQEEIFGPVLAVQVVRDLDEAIAAANGTEFGLAAGIYTLDNSAAHRFARDVDAGQVYINEYFAGGIEVPFGGNKKSGFGREKGLEALRSYCKLKSVAARI